MSALPEWWMAYDGRYKLALARDAEPAVFDLRADPLEATDIAAGAGAAVARLRQALGWQWGDDGCFGGAS